MTFEYLNPGFEKNRYIDKYLESLPDLSGKIVLDIPCGGGRATYGFLKKGATVKAFDLFPEFMEIEGFKAEYADLSQDLPVESGSVDYIVCQEGIEHMPNQLKMLYEFNRVLKKEGVLVITTPSDSHFRARLSNFLFETDYWKRMPPTEIDGVWFSEENSEDLYFGHLFLLGVQHFKTLLKVSGFKVEKYNKTKIGITSLIIGIPVYPIFALFTFLTWGFYRRKNKHVTMQVRDKIFWDRVKLNLSPKTLFCKDIFWIIKKENELKDVISELRELQRKT